MLLIIILALTLSVDAFSVSLIIGILENNYQKHLLFSLIVGALHFIMPSLGAITNSLFFDKYIINGNKLLGVTLLVLFFSMLVDIKKNDNEIKTSNLLVLALSVSIDSYFAGIGIKALNNYSILYFLVFSVFSCIISFVGCQIGRISKAHFGKLANYLAMFILLVLSVKFILFN